MELDGKPAGHTPLVVDTAPGRHLVEARKDDHLPFSAWVEVARGERKLVAVRLQPCATARPAVPVASSRG